MKKLYFLQVQNLIDGSYFLPTASGYLYSYCFANSEIKDNYDYGGTLFLREDIGKVINELAKPDIFCISTYVWNFEYSKKFALKLKEKWPNCLIIMGGPHVPYKQGFHKDLPFVDLVVMHEGERTLEEILLYFKDDRTDFENIKGVITSQSSKLVERPRINDLRILQSPCFNGFYDRILKDYPKLSFNFVIETNRGCPYSCSFCDMQDSFYQKITRFSLAKIFKELEWASENKIAYVDCADSNFGIIKRDIDIACKVADLKRKNGHPRFFNFTSAKNQPKHVMEIQKTLSEVGIDRGISISLQSFDKGVQKTIRRYNQPKAELYKKVKMYKEKGLDSFVEVILGLPGETKRTWINGIVDLLELDYTGALLVHPLSIVPNTPFTDQSYINEFDLRLTTTRSPAQGFNYGNESAEEREVLCVGSKTMTTEEWIDCYIFSKCLVGAGYFHGIAAHMSKFLKKEKDLPIGKFFEHMLDYSKESSNFLNKTYRAIRDDLNESLFNLRPFGRRVLNDDFYWSDQAAAGIIYLESFDEFYDDIWRMCLLKGILTEKEKELFNNLKLFIKYSLENPYQKATQTECFNYNWYSFLIEDKRLENNSETVHFSGRDWSSARDHALHVYWYGRKSRRCYKNLIKY